MKQSAGILLHKTEDGQVKFLLAHPGGPFWAKKDEGAWSIPKGEFDESEDALAAAKREFLEETGFEIRGECRELSPVRQKSGKRVYAWAVEQDLDASQIRSNTFEMEWPPKSGKMQKFPEIDRAEWFAVHEALVKILPAQRSFIEELLSGRTARI